MEFFRLLSWKNILKYGERRLKMELFHEQDDKHQ